MRGRFRGIRVLRLASREIGGRVWLRGLERCITQLRPDVVHCHNVLQFHPVRLALEAIGRAVWPRRGQAHADQPRAQIGGWQVVLPLLRHPGPTGYRALRGPLQCQKTSALRVMVTYGIRGPIEIMTLGVDTDKFVASPDQRHGWRSLVGIPQDALLFLYTGKLTPAKGLSLLLGAAIKLLRDGTVIHVALVGDAEPAYLDALRLSVAQAGPGELLQCNRVLTIVATCCVRGRRRRWLATPETIAILGAFGKPAGDCQCFQRLRAYRKAWGRALVSSR